MSKSPFLNLELTPDDESTKSFIAFRSELAGDAETSNMMILDTAIEAINEKCDTYDTTPITWEMLKNGLNYESET